MDKKIVLKAMEQLLMSPEWSIVKSQLEEERKNLQNNRKIGNMNWTESQLKASIECEKVYDNIIDCPENIFTSYGGQLQAGE